MKIKGALISDLSGKMGGLVASHNAGGQYLRQLVVPVNPNTTQQQAIRNFFSSLSAAWGTILTSSQRNDWKTYADNSPVTDRIGQVIVLSANAMYNRCNTARLQALLSRIDAAPTTFGLTSMTTPTVVSYTASTDVMSVGFTNTNEWAVASGGALLVYISRPQPLSTQFFKGPFQFAGKIAGAASPPSSPQNITSPFNYAAGQAGYVRFAATAPDGRPSNEAIVRFLAS